MSYQYPTNYIEHYSPSPSSASTPHALNASQWDSNNPPSLHDPSDAIQQQHQQQVLHSPTALNPSSASVYSHQHSEHSTPSQAPVYEPPTVIQLQERPPRRSALQRKADREASSLAGATATKTRGSHYPKQISPLSLHAPSPLSYEQHEHLSSPSLHTDKVNKSELASMPIRHQRSASRGQVRFSTTHPYNSSDRPVAGGSTSSGDPNLVTPSSLLGHYQKQFTPYATMAYSKTTDKEKPSPALSAMSSSPILTVSAIPHLESSYVPGPTIREGRYVARIDLHYSLSTKILTALLELPGIKKSAIKVKLVHRSGVKHLEIYGRSKLFSGSDIRHLSENDSDGSDGEIREKAREGDKDDGYYIIRERKQGEFKRVLIVPQDTTPDRVSITFEDGLLIIKIPCDQQEKNDMEHEESEIPIK